MHQHIDAHQQRPQQGRKECEEDQGEEDEEEADPAQMEQYCTLPEALMLLGMLKQPLSSLQSSTAASAADSAEACSTGTAAGVEPASVALQADGPAALALQLLQRGVLTGLSVAPRRLVLMALRHAQSSCRQQLEGRLDATAAEMRQVRHVDNGVGHARAVACMLWHLSMCYCA
jgi:hypothetical protein